MSAPVNFVPPTPEDLDAIGDALLDYQRATINEYAFDGFTLSWARRLATLETALQAIERHGAIADGDSEKADQTVPPQGTVE